MTGTREVADSLNKLSEQVIGAAIEVHRQLGAGFAERTYHRAMAIELGDRGLRYLSECPVALEYKGRSVGEGRIDLLVEEALVVELKASDRAPRLYRRQVVAHLKATGKELGLVINLEADAVTDGLIRVVNTK